MSDLFAVDRQVKQGAEWRDYVDVTVNGEDYELCIRQLQDDEFSHVVDIIGQDTFKEKLDDLSENADESGLTKEDLDRIEELQSMDADEMSESEKRELEQYASDAEALEESLAMMDPAMVEGMHYAGRQAVVPDEDDIDAVLEMSFNDQEELLGDKARTPDQAEELAKERVYAIFEQSTGFTAYQIGFTAFLASLGQGN